MRLEEARKGTYVTRKNKWDNLWVLVCDNSSYLYITGSVPGQYVQSDSIIFNHDDFVYCDEEGNVINKKVEDREMKKDVNYIGGDYRVVSCTFEVNDTRSSNKKVYNFKIDIDLNVSIDDIVVVETVSGYHLARVVNVFENTLENVEEVNSAKAWVVNVLNTTNQERRKKASERRQYLTQQLEERKAQIEAINMYQLLAEIDPTAAKLLDELKAIKV